MSGIERGLGETPIEVIGDDFDAWAAPHLQAMANLAARLVGPADRDDVVQESLTRAWQRWDTFEPEKGTPRTWLLCIVADKGRRMRQRRRPAPEPTLSRPPASTDDRLDLEAAITALSDRQRLAVDLYYFVGLDVAETAVVMGCAPGTVKSTLSDARARLRTTMEEHDGR